MSDEVRPFEVLALVCERKRWALCLAGDRDHKQTPRSHDVRSELDLLEVYDHRYRQIAEPERGDLLARARVNGRALDVCAEEVLDAIVNAGHLNVRSWRRAA